MPAQFCPRCGAPQAPSNLFCPKCGHALEQPAPPAQPLAGAEAPQPTHTAPRVSPDLLTQLQAEERELTRRSRRTARLGCIVALMILAVLIAALALLTR